MSATAYTPVAELIARSPSPYALCIDQYRMAPNAFSREVLGVEPDPWQAEANRALAHGHKRLAIRSGHGVGKGFWLSTVVAWFCTTRLPFKVAITSASAPQLHDALMGDVRNQFRRLPLGWQGLFDIDADRIKLKDRPDDCFVTARTSRKDNPESLQGVHSENTLLIADEASGIDEQIFEAATGSMSTPGAIMALTGNPTRGTGFFWRAFNMEPERWWTRRVSCHESPRVDPAFIAEILNRYGENSNQWRVRVLGDFPLADEDTVIPSELVDSAMSRIIEPNYSAPEVWGVDVARFGVDQSCLVKRRGAHVTEMPRRYSGIDTMQLAGIIKNEFDILPFHARPALIAIDVIGIGAGVVDRLMEQNLPVIGVNVAESPSTQGRFVRMRDQLWYACREWLESRAVQLPFDDRLRADLVTPRGTFLSDGRMQVESKTQLRSRGFPSPDTADALILTFTPTGMALQMGLGNMMNSRIPLRRSVAGME